MVESITLTRKLLFYIWLICFSVPVLAQEVKDDSWPKKVATARKLLNSQPREVLKIAQQYMEKASANRDEWSYADAHYLMGQYHLATGDYASAFQSLQKGMNYLNSKSMPSDSLLMLKSGISQAIGTVYRTWGMWPEALDAYMASLAIERKQQNQYSIAQNLINLGVLFEKTGDTLQSISHYRQGLALAEQINNKQLQAAALGNIAIYYKNQKSYLWSLKYQLQSLAIKKQINDLRGIANSLGNIGILHSQQKQYKDALVYGHQTRAIYEQLGDAAMTAHTMGLLGDLHLYDNQLDSAGYYLKKSFTMALAHNPKVLRESCESLYQLAMRHRDFRQALEYKIMADSINRVFFNSEKQRLTEQAKARYEWQQQQSELDRLKWEVRLQEMDNERQARIIKLLGQETEMREILAEKKQLELSLLNSQKKLLEEEQKNAVEQLEKQRTELRLQQSKNAESRLKIKLQAQQLSYNRVVLLAGVSLFLLSVLAAYLIIRRIRKRLAKNRIRHQQTINEIAYINSHQMRAPVATVLGLMNLIKMDMEQGIYNPYLLDLLDKTAQKLDEIVRQVSDITNQMSESENAQESD